MTGANIGALTVALADIVGPEGSVVAFEPQPQTASLLRRNVAELNVTVEECALLVSVEDDELGGMPGTVRVPFLFDLGHKNYGRVELGSGEGFAPIKQLDVFDLVPAFIKIDVEGAEAQVLRSAARTIERHRPLLYVENDRPEKADELLTLITEMGYDIHQHIGPLFNPDNFNH